MSDRSTFDGFSAEAEKTAIYPAQGTNTGLLYVVLGLVEGAGAVAAGIKRLLRDGVTPEAQQGLVVELGRTLYALDRTASELGVPLSSVAELNLDARGKALDAGSLRSED